MEGSPPPRRSSPSTEEECPASTERQTVVPDFDPQDFAHDSEVRQRIAPEVSSDDSTLGQAKRLHDEGHHEAALFLLARLLELAPLHPEGASLEAACREALEAQCLAVIGSTSVVLVAALSPYELKRYALDNVSGFLVSQLDGMTDVEALLDIAGLPRLHALRHLRKLVERGIVKRFR